MPIIKTTCSQYCTGALDDFKSVNLLHSYHAGDKLLLTLADRFRADLDPTHTIARVGGDVFAMVLPNLENHYEAADIAQKVLDSVRRPFRVDNHSISLSATIGITIYPDLSSDSFDGWWCSGECIFENDV